MRSWLGHYCCFLDVYIGQLCSLVGLHTLTRGRLLLPVTGGRFLVTGQNCPPQDGHNDFNHEDPAGPGFFIIVTGSDPCNLWIADGSHKNVNQPDSVKAVIAHVMEMDQITIPPHSVFMGHGFVQHAGAGWSGYHALRYHVYLKPEGGVLNYAVNFA